MFFELSRCAPIDKSQHTHSTTYNCHIFSPIPPRRHKLMTNSRPQTHKNNKKATNDRCNCSNWEISKLSPWFFFISTSCSEFSQFTRESMTSPLLNGHSSLLRAVCCFFFFYLARSPQLSFDIWIVETWNAVPSRVAV